MHVLCNLSRIINSADRAAGLVWQASGGPGAFRWRDALVVPVSVMAQYVAARPEATAVQLYDFCMKTAGERGWPSWEALPMPQRVAIEVFRATFSVLWSEAEAARKAREAEVAEPAPAAEPDRPRLRVLPNGIDHEVSSLEAQWTGDTGRPRRKGGGA